MPHGFFLLQSHPMTPAHVHCLHAAAGLIVRMHKIAQDTATLDVLN